MLKLLNSNVMRIKKSKLFLIMNLAIICVTLFMLFNQYLDFSRYNTEIEYDSLFNFFLIFIGIVISIFTGLFLSTEYADNTIKNKIIIGHKRIHIYLANLLSIVGVSFFFEIIFMLLVSVIGIPLFGFHISSISSFLYSLFIAQLIIIANAAIYTFISEVCSNSMLINVICILFAFGSYFATLILLDITETPEYVNYGTISNIETGQIEYRYEKNPKYPSETKRKVCNILLNIIPESQSIIITSNKVTDKKLIPLFSICTTIIITVSGIIIFKEKELK